MITCERDDLISACIFFLRELLPDCDLPDIDIDLYEMHTLKGWCAPEDDGYQICLDNTQPFEIVITTLAHECVHIKQYVMGQLEEKDSQNYWLGAEVDIRAYDDYYNLPWEIEAYDRELILFDLYIRKFNII